MGRRSHRIRIDDDGSLEIIDPGYDSLDLLLEVDPGFQIKQSDLPGFIKPRFLRLRNVCTMVKKSDMDNYSDAELWSIHDDVIKDLDNDRNTEASIDMLTLLELKIELAHRVLKSCALCARRCGVDRTQGERGICGLGEDAFVGEHFIHIAEEPPINPSLVLNMRGCGLHCLYCQQHTLLGASDGQDEELDASLWQRLDTNGTRSISFIGGNPDESLYAILKFLDSAPEDWCLPIVWNCHGYETPETLKLLNGVVDIYVPDFKYMSSECAEKLSNAADYPDVARQSIKYMLKQNVPVYVRVLVLPGHYDCCHRPALDFLASLQCTENLFVSIRDQYCPDWKIAEIEELMTTRPTHKELRNIKNHARLQSLSLIGA